jgi:hypothetical protein
VYYKGFEILVEAMVGLDTTLVLVGDGPLRGRLERRVDALGLRDRVQLVGEQDDVRPYFAACDVFVLPSTHRSEAFGIVQIEAMAFAKPVVSTRLGTGVEWVNRHGETAHRPVGTWRRRGRSDGRSPIPSGASSWSAGGPARASGVHRPEGGCGSADRLPACGLRLTTPALAPARRLRSSGARSRGIDRSQRAQQYRGTVVSLAVGLSPCCWW